MSQSQAPRRSMPFSPVRAGPPQAKILPFPQPAQKSETSDERARYAQALLMVKFGYTAEEAQVIIDDYHGSNMGHWDAIVAGLV